MAVSTLAELVEEYEATAGYDLENSLELGKRFVKVCRVLVLRLPSLTAEDGTQVQRLVGLIPAQLEKAEAWVAAASPAPVAPVGSRVRGYGFRAFRD